MPRIEHNGEIWLSVREAVEYSKEVLLQDRGIEKGYTKWRFHQLAKFAMENPKESIIRARKGTGPLWELEQASLRKWLNEVAIPHFPHATYDKMLPDGRVITVRSVKDK